MKTSTRFCSLPLMFALIILFWLRPWSYNEVIQNEVRNLMDVHIIEWNLKETIHMGVATGNSINIYILFPFYSRINMT